MRQWIIGIIIAILFCTLVWFTSLGPILACDGTPVKGVFKYECIEK